MNSASSAKGAVLITGTSSGIGRTTALHLDAAGYHVIAGVRRESDARKLKFEASSALTPIQLDITQPDQIAAAVELVEDLLRPAEKFLALINNAGIAEVGPLEYIDIERVRRQFDVGVFGHLAVTQGFIPLLRRGPGRIITVNSAIIDSPLPVLGPYCASMSAANALFMTLRRELRWFRIPVSLVLPGYILTPIWDAAPEVVARIESEDVLGRYRDLVHAMYLSMKGSLKWAADPQVVAKTIRRALEARWPKAEYRCGPGSRSGWVGKWIPESVVQSGLEWYVKRVASSASHSPSESPSLQGNSP